MQWSADSSAPSLSHGAQSSPAYPGCGDVDGGEVLLTWSGGEGVKPLLTLRMQEPREPSRVAVPRLAAPCASPRCAAHLAACLAMPHAPRHAPRLAAPLTSPRASPCASLCASPRCAAHLAARLAACLAMRLASRLAVFMLDVLNCTKWNQQLWG